MEKKSIWIQKKLHNILKHKATDENSTIEKELEKILEKELKSNQSSNLSNNHPITDKINKN